jgi:hypothetical protein
MRVEVAEGSLVFKPRKQRRRVRGVLVPVERFELPTNGLQNRCSTTELNRLGQCETLGSCCGPKPRAARLWACFYGGL